MHKILVQLDCNARNVQLKQSQLWLVSLQASSGVEGTERSQQASIACSDAGLHTPNLRRQAAVHIRAAFRLPAHSDAAQRLAVMV